MGYNSKTYKLINSIDHSYYWSGRYGAKGEKRAPRKKITAEQVKRQNQINKENKLRRLIQANFYPNDMWVCLKYPKGTILEFEKLKDDITKFIRRLRNEYKKRYEELKFVYRIEVGKRGGPHVHILINRIYGSDLLIVKCWNNGYVNITPMYEAGNFRQLAAYIVKPLPSECKQMSFIEQNRKALMKYSSSRNLIRPEPEKKQYRRRTMRKLMLEGPTPTPGFYIDKDSIRSGINEYTGYSYYHYTEIRIDTVYRKVKQHSGRKRE